MREEKYLITHIRKVKFKLKVYKRPTEKAADDHKTLSFLFLQVYFFYDEKPSHEEIYNDPIA